VGDLENIVLHSDFNELLPTMNDPNWMSRILIMPYVFWHNTIPRSALTEIGGDNGDSTHHNCIASAVRQQGTCAPKMVRMVSFYE